MIDAGCHRRVGFYLLVLSAAAVHEARPVNMDGKMLLVTTAGSERLNCFTQTLEDFACFWDERDHYNSSEYRFFYQYQNQDDGEKKECPLSMERIVSNTTRYICKFPMMDIALFAPLDVEVSLNSSVVLSRKDIYINHVVVLDPPSNVTVRRTGKPGQLHVKWSAPQFKYLENSSMYEVNFSSVGSSVQKVEIVKGKTECIILKLESQTRYLVSIRAKPDGVSMDGYWTNWSKSVSAVTDSVFLVTTAGSERLNCFTQTLEDFACFWDVRDHYNSSEFRFFYQYQYQDDGEKKECPLSMERIVSNTTRYICKFPMMDIALFAPLDVEVSLNSSVVLSRKDIYINHVVVLDPPSNVTVQRTGKPGQLHVKWSAPQFKYLENSLMYEVNFSSVGSSVQKVEIVKGKTECIILKLKSQTRYLVSIRAKPDGVSMDGYWTNWSKSVSAITDSVFLVTTAGSERLNCFTQTLEDFACFWDVRDHYNSSEFRFFYQYQYQDDGEKKECPLSMERIVSNTTRYICKFPMMDIALFAPLDVEVSLNSSVVLSRKDIYINHVVVLDPPSNVTVQRTGKPGQLHVKWLAPQFKYLENSLMYEVNFSSVGSSVQKVEIVKGKTECIILKLESQTRYLVSIRVKPDGVSMDGYWTNWSKSVSAVTDSDVDPLILSLSLVLVMIIMLLVLTILMTHRRTIKEKIWPLVPSPENMFDGLFTVYRGNFQEWLGRSSGQIWWNLQLFSTDEPATALEILSEIKTFPPGLAKIRHQDVFVDVQSLLVTGSDAHKLQRQTLMDEGKSPVRGQIAPDTKEAYVVLNQNFLPSNTFLSDACSFTRSSNDVSEEEVPLQLLFENPRLSFQEDVSSTEEEEEDCLQRASITRLSSHSSGIEPGSPASLVGFDPRGQIIYPSPLTFKLDTNYPYLMVSDSGVSADFSTTGFRSRMDTGIYTNLYKRADLLDSMPASNVFHSES